MPETGVEIHVALYRKRDGRLGWACVMPNGVSIFGPDSAAPSDYQSAVDNCWTAIEALVSRAQIEGPMVDGLVVVRPTGVAYLRIPIRDGSPDYRMMRTIEDLPDGPVLTVGAMIRTIIESM
jgi:hypothetical protein